MDLPTIFKQFSIIDSEILKELSSGGSVLNMDYIFEEKYYPLFYKTFDFLLDNGYICYYGEILRLDELSFKTLVLYVGRMFENDEQKKLESLQKVVKKLA